MIKPTFDISSFDNRLLDDLREIRSYPEPPKLRHMGKPLPDTRPKPKPHSPALARMLKMKGRR